jgi:hypothetical protein
VIFFGAWGDDSIVFVLLRKSCRQIPGICSSLDRSMDVTRGFSCGYNTLYINLLGHMPDGAPPAKRVKASCLNRGPESRHGSLVPPGPPNSLLGKVLPGARYPRRCSDCLPGGPGSGILRGSPVGAALIGGVRDRKAGQIRTWDCRSTGLLKESIPMGRIFSDE